ncbi:MAG: hypothetical protein GF408_07565 [Candidatus Omnitrophica bacterium]|nr:hypothetical protein [Candidatus Omnitrophota bacterium]
MTKREHILKRSIGPAAVILALAAAFFFFTKKDITQKDRELLYRSLQSSFDRPHQRMEITVEEPSGGRRAPYGYFSCSVYGCENIRYPGRSLRAHAGAIHVQALLIDLDGFRSRVLNRTFRGTAPLFFKVFVSGKGMFNEMKLAETGSVPDLYFIPEAKILLQERVWREIWQYALDPSNKGSIKIENIVIRPVEGAFEENITYEITMSSDGKLTSDFPAVMEFSPKKEEEEIAGQKLL